MTAKTHPFEPVFFGDSKVLILGSFPSTASFEVNFYYGHKRNRFWQVLGTLLSNDSLQQYPLKQCSVQEKINFLKAHKIALFDMVKTCLIRGSSDTSLKVLEFNPIESLLEQSQIQVIFTNGQKVSKLYESYLKSIQNSHMRLKTILHFHLPSTSPANAKYNLKSLCKEWQKLCEYL